MKKLIVTVIAATLLGATTGALADGRHKHGHHKHHGWKYHDDRKYYKGYNRGYKKGYKHGYRSSHGHYRYKPYNYRYRKYYNGHYYPNYLGAALIGSALTYSLYHTHNGNQCYEDHGGDTYRSSSSGGSSEVVGCHRIETLPNGEQRRVEVPISQCY